VQVLFPKGKESAFGFLVQVLFPKGKESAAKGWNAWPDYTTGAFVVPSAVS